MEQNRGTGSGRGVKAAVSAGLLLCLIGCMTLPAYRRPSGYSSTYHKHLEESPPVFYMDEAVVSPSDSSGGTHQHHDHRHHGHGHHHHSSTTRRRPRRLAVGAPPCVKRRDGHYR